jgi:hypothetical protein
MTIGQILLAVGAGLLLWFRFGRRRLPYWHRVLHALRIDHTVIHIEGEGNHRYVVYDLTQRDRSLGVLHAIYYGRQVFYLDLFPANQGDVQPAGVRYWLGARELFEGDELENYIERLKAARRAAGVAD